VQEVKMSPLPEIAQTTAGKIFVCAWLLMLAGAIGTALFGIADGEVAQTATFSILVASVLANVCTVISYWAGTKSARLARVSWLSLTVVALAVALVLFRVGQEDANTVLAYAMVVLTFPVGFIVGPMVGFLLPWGGLGSLIGYWVVSAIVGYLQWFVILPRLIASLRGKR
jgi:hypothetical protein